MVSELLSQTVSQYFIEITLLLFFKFMAFKTYVYKIKNFKYKGKFSKNLNKTYFKTA